MRTLVFELDHTGHRLQFVRVLIEALNPLCKEVILFTSEKAVGSDEYKIHLHEVESFFRLVTHGYTPYGGSFRNALIKLDAFRKALRNERADQLFVPYADGLAQLLGPAKIMGALDLSSKPEIEGIMMRGSFAYPADNWRDRVHAIASLAMTRFLPFEVLHQLDPISFSALKQHGTKFRAKCHIIPEPVEQIRRVNLSDARRQIGVPTDGRYIVGLGSGDIRKGTDLLVRAFCRAELSVNDRLLLMGKIDPPVRHLIESQMKSYVRNGRLILIDRYLSHELFCLGLNAADMICTPYPRHIGSSGIVVRAAALHKPVLASDYGWLGAVVPTFGLGWTCCTSNIEEFAVRIKTALDSAGSYRQPAEATRFVRFHTVANFATHITARIRTRTGEPLPQGMVSWSEVLSGIDNINPLLV